MQALLFFWRALPNLCRDDGLTRQCLRPMKQNQDLKTDLTRSHEAHEEIQDPKFQIQAFLCGLRGFV